MGNRKCSFINVGFGFINVKMRNGLCLCFYDKKENEEISFVKAFTYHHKKRSFIYV